MIEFKNDAVFSDSKHKWRTMKWLYIAYFILLNKGTEGQELISVDQSNENRNLFQKFKELPGGVVNNGKIVWDRSGSPYVIHEDIVIEENGELIVEPGVEVHFGPMVGITVRGVLVATGTKDRRITFTSIDQPMEQPKAIPDIRLVDGPTILAGRVQILHQGTWRSVCTNSRNWTIQDMETACRQMGFMGGSFYNWVDRQAGRHPRLLYEEPKCKGVEEDLFKCDWRSRQMGSGVCDYHPDIGIQCLPRHETSISEIGKHWRGIAFENAKSERTLSAHNTLYIPESGSMLKHISIRNAGVGRDNNATSAVHVIGVPPSMEDIEISLSAYNAINITMPDSPVVINNCTIRNNRGYGVYINSTYGLALVENCHISDNGGDGVKYVGHEINIDEKFDRSEIYDLCTLPSTASQTYPITMSLEQSRYANVERDCNQNFHTRYGQVLTVSFVKLLTNRNNSGIVSVYDGISAQDRLLLTFSIRNHSRPQSVTSTKNRIFINYHAETRTDILGFIRLSSGSFKSYDLNITESTIAENNGRGVVIENLRSQLHIHKTSISNNNHVAGMQVLNGAGDVNVTDSRISFNQGDGINITCTGGNRNISKSVISSNQGNGISIWINNTAETEYIILNQTTVVEYSEIFKNLEHGILHGNYCGESWLNITGNWFNNTVENAVKVYSCWIQEPTPVKALKLQIGHNRFSQSLKTPVLIQPAVNIRGRIEYNYFENGMFGAILIKNRIAHLFYEEFEVMPTSFVIQHNYFYANKGPFVVNLGLSPYSDLHHILFTRNYLRDNKAREPFQAFEGLAAKLIPRSRAAAVVALSSSNVDIYRNILNNPESQYEIGSHFQDQSHIHNCTFNWLGHHEEEKVYTRLFHRKDRYNLAKIAYMPYLLHSSNPAASQINSYTMYVPQFNIPGSRLVGGEIDGIELLRSGEYEVDKDINIRPGGKLILQPGVTLKFPPSIGMMIAGKLEARGKKPNDISFSLKEEIVMNNDSVYYETETENYEITTNTPPEPIVPIRLLGGQTSFEGRLQVRIEGTWGTVCNYRWNIINAALVCNQLGLALNPNDWYLERNQIPNAGLTEDVILSNVECTEYDTDITKCKAERVGDFENSCSHDNDVGVRCYETSWAGLRFGVLSERADLQFVHIEKSGLLDYATNEFKPALQIDFARHGFESIKVSNNYQDGLGVLYTDLYGADAVNTVRNSEFSSNRGSGISFKQLGLKISGTLIENNEVAGISHNPHITGYQQRELAGWFNMDPDFNIEESNYNPIIIPKFKTDVNLANGETRYIVTSKHYGENVETIYSINCNPGYVLGLQLLNPIHNFSSEQICIYDSQNINTKSDQWCLDRDLSTFPTTSSSFGIVLTYKSGTSALGGVVLVVSAIVAPVQEIRNRIVKGPIPTLQVTNSKIKGNTRGIMALYYNRYLNELGDHFLRKANETIKIINCEISHNKQEAIFVNTPFWDIHESNITEIKIMVNNSLIIDNGRGIYHFARDLRSSNNLYHYVLQDNTIERNKLGGFDVSLPYVWQYNENFTHSIFVNNNTWRNNDKFAFIIDGHYANVNITRNVLTDNYCKNGLISITGMEKRMKIEGNLIEKNTGRYMIEFNADSQSEILGEVRAIFMYNQVKHNKYTKQGMKQTFNTPDLSYVVGFKGIQKVKVSRNLFGENTLEYTVLAGIKTAKINNMLDITENWWGSTREQDIKEAIFDFDDWNNHAVATYRPYLLENSFDASVSVTYSAPHEIDINNIGGRITQDVVIFAKETPYIIKSDITVMPGAVLTINPGVVMEFAPNVGILVLGILNAQGLSGLEIQMRPLSKGYSESLKIEKRELAQYSSIHTKHRRQLEQMFVQDSIRLCTGKNCSINDNLVEKNNEGFLEYYNRTTLQWVPLCDNRFTERNAQVVCRELGFDPINVYFSFDRRIEYHSNSLSRIWSWPEPLQCKGIENRYEECPIRLNGQLYGHRHTCQWDSQYVFIHCGKRNLEEPKEYWGGIRFANSEFEHTVYEHRIHDIHTHGLVQRTESALEYVEITGAGILHNEKSPAIQTIVKNPKIYNVNISDCAHHGINLISPSNTMNLMFNQVNNVLGEGLSAISLTGEARESDESSFIPLKDLNLPYNLFSMIDICDTSKEIIVEERVLIYYKYDNNPVNCVKIFKSVFRVKPFGFRLLQFNLFNHTVNYGKRDSLSLYDGDIYNISAPLIGYLEHGSSDERRLFRTEGASLSVKLFANGASAVHGFIAEVVTLPISAIGFNRDVQHNISNSEFSGNREGGLTYHSVGEVNPMVTLDRNQFVNNCKKLYGNFTTCNAAVKIDVQNMQTLYFRNNLVRDNIGGLSIRADSSGSATALKGWIHNNLFFENKHQPTLYAEGRQSSPYQEVTIYRNYFTRNKTPFKDVIVLKQVVSNFTHNYVHENSGMRIMDISGFDKVRLPIYQTTSHNGFYKNYALDREGRATIVAGTAGQHYVDNIFFNPDNDYEIITVNRSIFVDFNPNTISALELWRTKIDASHNYWSYNETIAVGGRIRDMHDDPLLLEVDYSQWYMNNASVLNGKCPPGWEPLAGTCYMYIGAPMTYDEAREFCVSDNASMPYVSGNMFELYKFILKQNEWYQYSDRVWVNHIDYVTQCTSFAYNGIEIRDCNQKNAFLCEIDPKIEIDPLSWQDDALTVGFIGLLALTLIFIAAVLACWYSKSKHRHMQRLERRNSIRQSLHSVRSLGSINGAFSDMAYRRKMGQMGSRSTDTLTKSCDYKKMLASSASVDSMAKSQFNSSVEDNRSYDIYEAHNPNPKALPMKPTSFGKKSSPQYSIPHSNTTLDMTFKNDGYNSGLPSAASVNTVLTEEIPILQHSDMMRTEAEVITPTCDSPYFTSDTLPLRGDPFGKSDDTLDLKRGLDNKVYGAPAMFGGQPKLSFLMELRTKMPETLPPANNQPQSTFGQRRTNIAGQEKYYEEHLPAYSAPLPPQSPSPPPIRSRSEALLETDFECQDDISGNQHLTEASRSYSQPLETAM